MDPFHAGREGEEELFGFIRTDAGGAETSGGEEDDVEDGSQFLNDSDPGMEPDMAMTAAQKMTMTAGQKMLDRQRCIKPLVNHCTMQ
jgi:hypothetical protein